jgi:hypothetical protein
VSSPLPLPLSPPLPLPFLLPPRALPACPWRPSRPRAPRLGGPTLRRSRAPVAPRPWRPHPGGPARPRAPRPWRPRRPRAPVVVRVVRFCPAVRPNPVRAGPTQLDPTLAHTPLAPCTFPCACAPPLVSLSLIQFSRAATSFPPPLSLPRCTLGFRDGDRRIWTPR